MLIISKIKKVINDNHIIPPNEFGLARAANLLKKGKIIAFPTNTVYGLGVDARNDTAVKKLIKTKGRSPKKPLPIHVKNIEECKKIAILNTKALNLAEKFWPGELTIILPMKKNNIISKFVNAKLDTLAIRIPKNPITYKLLQSIDFPITSTSANLSGHPSALWPEMIIDQFKRKIPLILDGGTCKYKNSSTIIDLTNNKPFLIREGAVSKEKVEAVIGKLF